MTNDHAGMVQSPDFGADTDPRYYNEDLAPTRLEQRTWDKWQIAALWVGMSVCVPTYMLASSLIKSGMDWKQAIGTVFLANLLVLIPMILNAHAGTRYGIPFPVYCRIAFGLVGANVPGLMRGFVACGWFGIQTWIGGNALYVLLNALGAGLPTNPDPFAPNVYQFACFFFFWILNMAIVWRGIDSIKTLEKYGAPFLLCIGVALLAWAYVKADGFGPMLGEPSKLTTWPQFWAAFAPGLTANVAFWATLSLNIPDFTRYARSQKDQMLGQAIGLPPTMTAFAFVGVAVTSATIVIFGEPIWDPIKLSGMIGEGKPLVVMISMLAFGTATLTTNLAANVVSPANDFAHLAPKQISFRVGGIITGLLGIAMMPWKLLADPSVYIDTWLSGYGTLLGSIGGILLVEYWIISRRQLVLEELYSEGGRYPRWRPSAIIAFLLGAAPCLPGFLHAARLIEVAPVWHQIYSFSVFVSCALAALFYFLFSLGRMKANSPS